MTATQFCMPKKIKYLSNTYSLIELSTDGNICLFLGPNQLNAIVMMDLVAPTVHSLMSTNANTGLVLFMPNVQTPWAVLRALVEKVMRVMDLRVSPQIKSMKCHTLRKTRLLKSWTISRIL